MDEAFCVRATGLSLCLSGVKRIQFGGLRTLWILVQKEQECVLFTGCGGRTASFRALGPERVMKNVGVVSEVPERFLRKSYLSKIGRVTSITIFGSAELLVAMYTTPTYGIHYPMEPLYVEFLKRGSSELWQLSRPLNGKLWSHSQVLTYLRRFL